MIKHVRKTRQVSTGLIVVLLAVVAMPTHAEDAPDRDTRFFDQPPTVEELASHLFPARTRSLVIGVKPNTDGAALAGNGSATQSESTEKSIGLPVLFHFGKTTLVDSSRPYLDQVGKLMLQQGYLNETLIIEGHTDAVGSVQYNERLSELRALAVKQYLVQQYNIDPKRLFPQGKGESLLFDEQNPRASVNRRVEFLRFQPG